MYIRKSLLTILAATSLGSANANANSVGFMPLPYSGFVGEKILTELCKDYRLGKIKSELDFLEIAENNGIRDYRIQIGSADFFTPDSNPKPKHRNFYRCPKNKYFFYNFF